MMARSRRRRLAGGCVGLALLVSAGCDSPAERQQETVVQNAAPSRTDAGRLRWAQSEEHFTFSLSSSAGLPGGGEGFSLSVEGRLQVLPTLTKAGHARLLLRLPDPSVRLEGAQDEGLRSLRSELSQPVLLEYDGGRLVSGWYPENASVVAIGAWRSLANALQLIPSERGETRWETTEYDGTGRYHARYTATSEPGSRKTRITREKLRYESLVGSGEQAGALVNLLPKLTSSKATFDLAGGEVQAVTSRDEVETEMGPGAALTARVVVSVRRTELSGDPSLDEVDLAALRASARQLPPERALTFVGARARASFDRELIRGKDFDVILRELESGASRTAEQVWTADDDGELSSEQKEMARGRLGSHGTLAAFFRSEPSTIGKALSEIKRKKRSSAVLVSALGAAGAVEAQRALVEIMGLDEFPSTTRSRALIALAQVSSPDQASVDAVFALAKDAEFERPALLALGAMSRRLREAGFGARAEPIRVELRSRLRSHRSQAELLAALRATSNSGDIALLGEVKPHLTAAEASVRGAAIRALRHMKGDAVDTLLASRMQHETEPQVLRILVRVLRSRVASVILVQAAQELVARSELPADVRRQLEARLTRWRGK